MDEDGDQNLSTKEFNPVKFIIFMLIDLGIFNQIKIKQFNPVKFVIFTIRIIQD